MNTHVERQRYNQARLCKGAPPRRQRGIVIVLTAIAMLVLLGIAAMSLDGGHMILNNARLQNVVDAAALEGAAVLSNNGTSQQAADAAEALLLSNVGSVSSFGYQEINAELGGDPANINAVIDFNDMLVSGEWAEPDEFSYTFIRVTVSNLPLQTWFMQIFGLSKGVSVSAVSAAVRSDNCDVVPVVLCAAPDADPDDPLGGYVDGELSVLKLAAGDDSDLGPGNFRLLKLAQGNGPPNVAKNLAGSFAGCPDIFETKPGNNVGPVVKGLNTRFFDPTKPPLSKPEGLYQADYFDNQGPSPHFPGDPDDPAIFYDTLEGNATETINWDDDGDDGTPGIELDAKCTDNDTFKEFCFSGSVADSNYRDAYASFHEPAWALNSGRFERRIIGVPVATCDGDTGGSVPADVIGLGCFFLMQPAIQNGNDAHIFGEFIEACSSFPFPDGAADIVLYKDPDREDS